MRNVVLRKRTGFAALSSEKPRNARTRRTINARADRGGSSVTSHRRNSYKFSFKAARYASSATSQ